MAPSVKPAARLSERPFLLAVGASFLAGDERSWPRLSQLGASLQIGPFARRRVGSGGSPVEALSCCGALDGRPSFVAVQAVVRLLELDLRSGEATR